MLFNLSAVIDMAVNGRAVVFSRDAALLATAWLRLSVNRQARGKHIVPVLRQMMKVTNDKALACTNDGIA
jgi:hypothetical protein